MTLEEAIDHALLQGQGASRCAQEHKQLFEWLCELRDRRARDVELQAEKDEA